MSALLGLWSGSAVGAPSAALALHTAIYDPMRQSMVLFGGASDSPSFENATWRLELGSVPRWALWIPSTAPPSGRLGHSAIYDPVRDRMIVFGGWDNAQSLLNDVWLFSLTDSSWTHLQPDGSPPGPRRYHSAIYDPARDRMVVFGGDQLDSLQNDVWSLWLSPSPRWERLVTNGIGPSRRSGHAAIYDPVRDRMLVFGGTFPLQNDVWALSFTDMTWTLLGPTGTLPAPRFGHTAIYDPGQDRMVAFGGSDGNQYLDDVWLLSLTSPLAWSRLSSVSPSPTGREYHSAVYDSAFHRMVIFGGIPTASEPTWALSLGSTMRWSPWRAFLEVSPSELVLSSAVTVGDTVAIPFSVSNLGLEPLAIEELDVSAPGLRVSPGDPLQIPWSGAASESLWVAALTPGALQDSVVIVSNDPVTPRRQVGVRVEVRALDFDAHVLNNPDSVTAGVSFIVVVTPKPGVTVERGKLYYRIADGSSPFDSLTLTPLATDFIGAVPASVVTERGVEFYARVENSGFFAAQPSAAPASFYTQQVASPTAIAAVIPRPSSGSDFLVGQDVTLDVVLPDGAIFDSGTLHFRRGGDQPYASLPLTPTGIPGQTSATIPDSLVGPRGIEYWVEVNTLRSTLRYPGDPGGVAILRTKVPNLVEDSGHSGGRYRLLTVPIDFGPAFPGSLDDLLSDQLGTYDPTRWRSYVYDPVSSSNIEFSSAQGARFRPEPGRAFWLISRDAHRVDTNPVAGLSTSTAAPYSITLARGWNLFGNPFDFAVAWVDVVRDAGIVGDPVWFDPSRGTIGDYADAAPSVLTPFDGYFVYATQPTVIHVPAREAPPPIAEKSALTTKANAGGTDWRFRLSARTELAVDGSNVFGVCSGASDAFDGFDQRKPPLAPGAWVRAEFAHADWAERSGGYRFDLRAPGSEGATWEIEVRSSAAGEPVTLDISELASTRPGLALSLIDREQGTATPPFRAGSDPASSLRQRIVSFGPRPYRLAIAAGSEAYVARAAEQASALPSRLSLEQNAPNPFRLATRVRFALPRPARVSLEVYDVLGERVATLLEGSRLEGGYHTAVWDGSRAGGAMVASGVYLIRLEVDSQSFTRRAVFTR